ncbi:ABC-three component system protein [Actinosynnema mirum]|uniref:ABC-three component systems C-terminal domain-containing protein n=1 Tax=Actinosynnema mirum (strain ATCC 29888 / DSM 43827 / JCM 3225 / NBRC 14064 / NCIMB 13271 / NRRL B-12336 / IMRU 3971 / 101) TaxID=446462 RepID=C6W808_ACTMD|nr:ABC-three component system protein [Actinosynnema mirum]ACU37029.1 conserved hypothetical protein [Actinosynnema mirum DSM 43827]
MGEQLELFEASASAVGYLHQLRRALLFCFEQFQSGVLDWSVAVEAGDDIEVQREGERDLWQLKHRAPDTRITNADPDLWKSLRIWVTQWNARGDSSDTPTFFLLTTADAAQGSAAYYLRPPGSNSGRDETKALEVLDQARANSKSKTNKAAYEEWDKLDAPQRRDLLAQVQVLDAGPDIEQVRAQLIGLASIAVGHKHAEVLVERMDGWFLQRVVSQLRDRSAGAVTGLEFDEVFSERRDEFRPGNLPIDAEIADLDETGAEHGDKTFVHQLRLVGVGGNRVRHAVRDYMRAFAQRSRWSNENLLRPGELGKYERRLLEEWETRFDAMCDDLGEQAAEEEKVREAKAIYRWVEQDARFAIRPGCEEPFVTKGSYHMLADEQSVGWHPDFVARLMALLEPVGGR